MKLSFKDLALVLAFTVIGIVIGYFGRQIFVIQWKGELDVGDLLNLCTALMVAFLLTWTLQKRISDIRVEKDIAIQYLKDSLISLQRTRSECLHFYHLKQPPAEKSREIVAELRTFSQNLDSFETLVKEIDFGIRSERIAEIKIDYISYKQLTTGEGFPSDRYSNEYYRNSERCFSKLKVALQKLIIEINRF